MYGALVAVTLIAFAAIAYVTVSSELYQNLDASLSRAGSSLLAVLRKEQAQARKPLVPVKKTRRATREKDLFSVLQQTSVRDFVGPVAATDSAEAEQDPVWSDRKSVV